MASRRVSLTVRPPFLISKAAKSTSRPSDARDGRSTRLSVRPVAPPQESLDPGQQHLEVEGLGQVVVGSRLEPQHHVLGKARAR